MRCLCRILADGGAQRQGQRFVLAVGVLPNGDALLRVALKQRYDPDSAQELGALIGTASALFAVTPASRNAPAAVGLPLSFALLCGSGIATTQSLFGFFVEPAQRIGYDPLRLGAVVACRPRRDAPCRRWPP